MAKRVIEKGEPSPLTENTICWENGSRTVEINAADPKLVKYIKSLPESVIIHENRDGSVLARIPKSMVLIGNARGI